MCVLTTILLAHVEHEIHVNTASHKLSSGFCTCKWMFVDHIGDRTVILW